MMDFPASPTVGQIANGYVWNGVLWAGSAPSAGGAIVSISDTAPSAPADNSLFWQSSTGAFYVRYNDGSSAQYVQLNSWPTSLNFVPTTGGTMSGDLTISKATPLLVLNKAASAQTNTIMGRMAGKERWWVYVGDATAESGSNVGSDFVIHRFNDAGTWIDGPLTINRATGVVTATGLPPIPQSGAVVGQWRALLSAAGGALVLPAGGTWAYMLMGWNANLTWNTAPQAFVAAGGSTVANVTAGVTFGGFAWRIA